MIDKNLETASIKLVKESNNSIDYNLAFVWAASNGYIKHAKALLGSGKANIDYDDGLALKYAAVHDFYNMAEFLISKGASASLLKKDDLILRRIFLLNNKKMFELLDIEKTKGNIC